MKKAAHGGVDVNRRTPPSAELAVVSAGHVQTPARGSEIQYVTTVSALRLCLRCAQAVADDEESVASLLGRDASEAKRRTPRRR
jgi:hypothetical protein